MMEPIILDQQNMKNVQFLIVVTDGNLMETKKLLDEGADVNFFNSYGNTPLHIAVCKGYLDIVKLLLANKANINILNNENDTALDMVGRCKTTITNNKIFMEIQKFIIDQSFEILEEFVISQESLEQHKDNKPLENEETAATKLNKIQANANCEQPKDNTNKSVMLNIGSVTLISASGVLKFGPKNLESIEENLNKYLEKMDIQSKNLNRPPEQRNLILETSITEIVASNSPSMNLTMESNSSNNRPNVSVVNLETSENVSESIKNNEILSETNEFEEKIQSCQDLLNVLKETIQLDKASLTYGEANICLLFLDAFLSINLITKDPDSIKQSLFDDYLSNYYLDFKRDLEALATMRRVLSNNSSKKFTLEDISKYICLRSDKTTILKSLSEYIDFLCAKIESEFSSDSRADTNSATFLPNLLHRTEEDLAYIGIHCQDILKEELANFIKAVYVQKEWTVDHVNEILFSFLVNISSGGRSNGPSGLKELREKVISKYHTYKNVPIVMKLEFERGTFVLRSILFKYYLAKEVFAIMYTVNAEEDIKQMEEKLRQSWLTIEEEFKENYKMLATGGQETSFEQTFFQSSLSSANEELALKEFVKHFWKFMIIIKAPKIEKQYKIQSPWGIYDLRDDFQKFTNLKQLKTISPLLYAQVREELKNEISDCNVQVSHFDEVCDIYLDNVTATMEEIQYQTAINETIFTIRKWRTRFNLSNHQTLFFYDRLLELNGDYGIDRIKDCLRSVNVQPDANAEIILTELDRLYLKETIEIQLRDTTIVRETNSFISNMHLNFFNLYNSYKIKFNSLEEAFKDTTFIDNLVRGKNMDWSWNGEDKHNFSNQFLSLILLELKYIAPYVASLITEEGNANILEKKSLMELTEILLGKGSFVYRLNDLLNVESEGVDLYEIICSRISEQNLENLTPIFQEPNQVTKILNHIHRSSSGREDNNSAAALKKQILILLSKIAYDFYAQGSYETALQILQIYNREMCDADELELVVAKRTEAMVKFNLGLEQIELDQDAEENFRSCFQILESIIGTMNKVISQTYEQKVFCLLSLILMAKTQSSLKNYAESFAMFESLYQKIQLIASGEMSSSTVMSSQVCYKDILAIKESKMYKEFLDYSFETKEGLNVGLLTNLMSSASKNEALKCAKSLPGRALKYYTLALNIYKEAYFAKKKMLLQRSDHCTPVISGNIAFVNSRFAILNFNFSPDVAFQYCILALKFYNETYNIRKELQQDNEQLYNTVKNISYNMCQIVRCSNSVKDKILKHELHKVKLRHRDHLSSRFRFK